MKIYGKAYSHLASRLKPIENTYIIFKQEDTDNEYKTV